MYSRLLLLPLTALLALPLAAQESDAEAAAGAATEATQQDDLVFDETVDVNVVNVDVYVTDKQGNPITGLTQDDFLVYEDKRPVTITNFYAVESGTPVAGALPQDTTEELPVRNRDPLKLIPEDQRLSLIVYVDNFNIRPFNRNRVFRRLREFLQQKVSPGDRVMLVSYDRSIHVRHPFTTDASLISHATFDLEKLTGYAVHRDSERRDLLVDIEEADRINDIQWRVKQYAESRFNDLSFTVTALKDFVETLAGLPGRKALLYVSDGLEMTAGEDLYHAISMKFQNSSVLAEMRDHGLQRDFRTLAHAASTGRVTFYTIDAAGLRVYSSGTAERATANLQPGMDTQVDQIHISNLQSPLQFLAEQTGGFAIINTNDVGERLGQVAADFSNYYSLGYTPSHAGDGRYYKIRVELKDPKPNGKKLSVRHRMGYRDRSTYTRMSDGTISTLRYNVGSNPLGVQIALGEGRAGEKHYMVPIAVTVPFDEVVLVEQNDVWVGSLKLFFSAMDAEGDLADVTEVPLSLRIPADKIDLLRGQRYPLMRTELQMRKGGHRVGVGVRDEFGANESFVTREILVGS